VAGHVILLPLADKRDEKVTLELSVKDLTKEVQIRHEGSLKNDRDVRGVEQLNRVRCFVSTNASAGELKFNPETLLVKLANDFGKDIACGQTSKEVSLVALCLTLAYVLRIRTAKYHHKTRFDIKMKL